MALIEDYPDVVIHEVAKQLDYSTIRAMKLVSRRLHSALSDPLLWIDLCERDDRPLPSRAFRKSLADQAREDQNEKMVGQLDFERVWVKNPFRANLMRSPILPQMAEMGREYGWKFSDEPYASMKVEEPPQGTVPHPDIVRCFATSHQWGQRCATVHLTKEGLPEWLLDHVRPRIVVSELVAPRFDCASEYHLHAQLLRAGEPFDTRAKTGNRVRVVEKEWPQWTNPAHWERVETIFEDYPAGMRTLTVISRGKDRQFWAGNYGAKFANLQVRIEMPDEARWLAESDFPEVTTEYDDFPTFITNREVTGRPGGFFGRFRRFGGN
ncbi:hypothetical protein PMAYCL1PPCAC_04334 [Pristionchus mayeri]|uniref:F-box domain-containing protein n=1 Tax=Pristionchus mayeri TaxID=1317129 RepID=A0AAN4Z6Q6_9BILA|nr:hypothetical protein PMAYCL1PPCAC_04334 [Pristionchus mayeri]